MGTRGRVGRAHKTTLKLSTLLVRYVIHLGLGTAGPQLGGAWGTCMLQLRPEYLRPVWARRAAGRQAASTLAAAQRRGGREARR